LDWVIKLLDWVGLDLANWTHVQLWGADRPTVRDNSEGGKGLLTVKYRDYLPWAVQKWVNRS